MKKQLKWMMAAILFCGTCVSAQAQDYPKHEIAASYGVLSNSDWINIFEDLIEVPLSGKLTREGEKYYGPIGVEYFYRAAKMVSVGGVVTYGHRSYDLKQDGVDKGELSDSYLTVMPAVKFNWYDAENVGFYSKLAFGATYRSEKDDHINYDKSDLHINWHISLFGFEAGGRQLRGFVELGVGEQGVALAGLRYKF